MVELGAVGIVVDSTDELKRTSNGTQYTDRTMHWEGVLMLDAPLYPTGCHIFNYFKNLDTDKRYQEANRMLKYKHWHDYENHTTLIPGECYTKDHVTDKTAGGKVLWAYIIWPYEGYMNVLYDKKGDGVLYHIATFFFEDDESEELFSRMNQLINAMSNEKDRGGLHESLL